MPEEYFARLGADGVALLLIAMTYPLVRSTWDFYQLCGNAASPKG